MPTSCGRTPPRSFAWRAAIKAEWLATVVAEELGGQGLGSLDLALALEQAGRQLLMVPLNEAAAVAWTMSRAVDDSRTRAALADLLRGALIVPATAAAATIAGLIMWVSAPRPWRPS